MSKIALLYATKSEFKRQEIKQVMATSFFRNQNGDDQIVGDKFEFEFSDVKTDEPLEVDLAKMVRHKAVSAYKALLTPCLVEHAGIILEEYASEGFPGGLTQPMMDSLQAEAFVKRMSCADEKAIARAVFGYCDGMSVQIFVGDTHGTIAAVPKGERKFYWDTIFSPAGYGGKTYAEITSTQGIAEKMKVSQSFRALKQFLEFRAKNDQNTLFYDFGG